MIASATRAVILKRSLPKFYPNLTGFRLYYTKQLIYQMQMQVASKFQINITPEMMPKILAKTHTAAHCSSDI